MSIEDLPALNPPDFGEVADATRPILSFAWRKEGAHRASAHSHSRAHIIHPTLGAYWAITPDGTWLVPSGQAIWIPPRVHHEIYAHGTVEAWMIFVDETYARGLPGRCGTVVVSSLVTELVMRAVQYGNDYTIDGPPARIAKVLLDELVAMKLAPLLLPISRDTRVERVMRALVSDPGSQLGLEELAEGAGASPRTLARLFRGETGMTFSEWRTRLRLVESVDRLARGRPVTEVALDLGYKSTSSFVYAFRRNMGVSPGRYRSAGR
jgi:AraC-like DNA-binding protein